MPFLISGALLVTILLGDVEDKLIAAPEGMQFSRDEIAAIHFQEKYYETHVEVE